MNDTNRRISALDMSPAEFSEVGHELVDRIAKFLSDIETLPLTRGESPGTIRRLLGSEPLPARGTGSSTLVRETAEMLIEHSLFNGHPQFYGYITSSAAPIGALGDLLAAAVNPNLGSFILSPLGTEIEAQAVRWIAELIGFPAACGGILVSGGNMANFVGFLAARTAKATGNIREEGVTGKHPLRLYASTETHTWIKKAADLFGLGTNAIHWIGTDKQQRMETSELRKAIREDKAKGHHPFFVVGTAGTVSTGMIDPLTEIASICREENMWFHVDGAYGGFAAALPDAPEDVKSLSLADSIAVDPHKWLYAPLEVGCALVRDPKTLHDTFSFEVPYYRFHDSEDEAPLNYFEYGPQNSRGFRALKVWLALRQAGREGYVKMISDDIVLARELYATASQREELQMFTLGLSIATFRFVPKGLPPGGEKVEAYLNELNTELLRRLQHGGEAFISNAIVNGTFSLRACIVNFRTSYEHVRALPDIIIRVGRQVDVELRPSALR